LSPAPFEATVFATQRKNKEAMELRNQCIQESIGLFAKIGAATSSILREMIRIFD
jgi:hypothetical protein